MRNAFTLMALACAWTCACGPRDPSVREVTWADVQPLLAASCTECHAERGRYERARDDAPVMLAMIEAGLMPPGGIDRSGACGDFVGPRPFTDEETEILRAWIDAGAPRGESDEAAVSLTPRSQSGVTVPLTLAPTEDPSSDVQRCVAIDVGAAGFLVGVQMDAPPAAHHAMVFSIDDNAALPPEPWLCDGVPRASSGESGMLAFAWVPGRAEVRFPDGAGVALSSRVIVQLHEHGVVDDQDATLTLSIVQAVERELVVVPVAHAGFSLAPGGVVEVTREVALPAGALFGVMPHLHEAGRSLTLTGERCIVAAPRYDFAFQEVAFFAEPITTGGVGTLTCTWDTSDRSTPTRWGEDSLDEMCTVFLFVARPRRSGAWRETAASRRNLTKACELGNAQACSIRSHEP